MKSLFDEKSFRWTPEAQLLGADLVIPIRKLFEEYQERGYSPREISHILMWIVIDEELMSVLDFKPSSDLTTLPPKQA